MDAKEKLSSLKIRNEELKPIIFKGAKTNEELDKYIESIRPLFDEYYSNQSEIDQLEWDLMTPEEQATKLEQRRLAKLKREGKLF